MFKQSEILINELNNKSKNKDIVGKFIKNYEF